MRNDVSNAVPILIPMDLDKFLELIRVIIREELKAAETAKSPNHDFETPGMTHKPLYKMKEVCSLFGISRPTIYDWVKHGKLKPYKIRSRVYFLREDVQRLLNPGG